MNVKDLKTGFSSAETTNKVVKTFEAIVKQEAENGSKIECLYEAKLRSLQLQVRSGKFAYGYQFSWKEGDQDARAKEKFVPVIAKYATKWEGDEAPIIEAPKPAPKKAAKKKATKKATKKLTPEELFKEFLAFMKEANE